MRPGALALRSAYKRDALETRTREGATRQRGKEGEQEVEAGVPKTFLNSMLTFNFKWFVFL